MSSTSFEKQSRNQQTKAFRPLLALRKVLVRLKHLGLGIHLLYHFARGIGNDQLADGEFSVVDQLPSSLESLRIYGYTKKMKAPLKGLPRHMFQSEIKKLKEEKNQKLPLLRVIKGIDQTIANAKSIKKSPNLKGMSFGKGKAIVIGQITSIEGVE